MIESKRHRGWVLVLVLLALLLATVVWFLRTAFPGPITRIGRYPEILTWWQTAQPTYVAHFPAAIPPSASGARMHFQPGVLQGGTSFELRYILPGVQFQAEAARARGLAAAYLRDRKKADYEYVTFHTDPESASPTRLSLTIGTDGANDRWGITLDPTRNEICYWVIDD